MFNTRVSALVPERCIPRTTNTSHCGTGFFATLLRGFLAAAEDVVLDARGFVVFVGDAALAFVLPTGFRFEAVKSSVLCNQRPHRTIHPHPERSWEKEKQAISWRPNSLK
jgi:hypothetical protein